jgi:hypothetical protein
MPGDALIGRSGARNSRQQIRSRHTFLPLIPLDKTHSTHSLQRIFMLPEDVRRTKVFPG